MLSGLSDSAVQPEVWAPLTNFQGSRIPDVGASVPFGDVSRHHREIYDELHRAISDVLASGWFSQGSRGRAFESEFAAYCGLKHCVGVANGTDAIELALKAAGCGEGDRVATVANAGGYTTTATLAARSIPIYVDVDESLTLAAEDLARVLELPTKPRAVVVTHLYGQLADMAKIRGILDGRDIVLIEDCAQAHGAERAGTKAGAFGDLAVFSFYPTKNLGAIGDAGAVVTNRDDLAERVRRLSQYGWAERYISVLSGGRNSRLDEVQAAILRVKLPLLDRWNEDRRAIVARYRAASTGTSLIFPHDPSGKDYVAHLSIARHPRRDELRRKLASEGVSSALHYPLLDYEQPSFRSRLQPPPALPTSEAAQGEIFSLPCFPGMTEGEISRVCDAIARHG